MTFQFGRYRNKYFYDTMTVVEREDFNRWWTGHRPLKLKLPAIVTVSEVLSYTLG